MAKYGILITSLVFTCTSMKAQYPVTIFTSFTSAKILFLCGPNTAHSGSDKRRTSSCIQQPAKTTSVHLWKAHNLNRKHVVNLWESKVQTKSIFSCDELNLNGYPVDSRGLSYGDQSICTKWQSPLVPETSIYPFAISISNRNAERDEIRAPMKNSKENHLQNEWLAVFLTLIIAGNIYAVYKYRMQQLTKVASLRTRISQDLHDNIGAALSSISMFCHAAIQKNESGNMLESKKILEKIGETSRDVMKDLNESVWLINPVNDNLQKIIQRINNYALPLCTTKNIHFEVSAAESIQDLDLSVEKRKAIYLFLKEAINNCLKYAAAKNLLIQFAKNRKMLSVSIKDDGVGFTANSLNNGNGLNNMKQRSKDINGMIEFKSMIRKGTEIKMQVPLNDTGS